MIPQAPAIDSPEFCALMMNALLFKLGGQVTLSIGDIVSISHDYPSTRIALAPGHDHQNKNEVDKIANSLITLTLLSTAAQSDKPQA